ncbi:MAG: class I SAM-dependent methyltransferase [Methanobacteriota archaeon]|nr:MAG: class I SAM-dependent methyltransferase [Euryarchaeota archaeon]
MKAIPHATLQFLGPILVHQAIRKQKNLTKSHRGLDDAVDFAFTFRYLTCGMSLVQDKREIRTLLDLLNDLSPKNCLEIGTAGGGTLFLFSRVVHEDAKLLSVDLPGGRWGLGYPYWKIPFYRSFARAGQEIILIRHDSHNPTTFERVKEELAGEKLDFLFLDGDHTYEGVKKDFEMYSPLVRKGGLIVLHDIVPNPSDKDVGVFRFWNEIRQDYEHSEIIESLQQGCLGIGVLYC